MKDISSEFANLSPERRALLTLMLQQSVESPATSRKIHRRSEAGYHPLSFAQQRLWFLAQMDTHSAVYNIPVVLRIRGALNVAALASSLDEIVRRHEVLRATFTNVGGQPAQVVGVRSTPGLPLVDLTEVSGAPRDRELRDMIREESHKEFDLERGPLMRLRLIRMDERDHVLQLVLHHIVSDEWSATVFIREVKTLYHAFANAKPLLLPELPIQYSDFAQWQREWLTGEVLEEQLNYWREKLAGAPSLLEMPTDKPRPPLQTYAGTTESVTLDGNLTHQLRALCNSEEVTMFMLLLAAFKVLLYRYSGQTDILVGTPIANRNHAEIEDLIGFFSNTLVLRTTLSPQSTFRQLVREVRELALGAYSHQDVPFERVVEEMQPERDLSRTPLFQTMFEFRSRSRDEERVMDGLEFSGIKTESTTAKFDL
ncbi:MAG: non-ribosomal peptide synthetase, partial [Acidobacteria bacterium]